MQRVPRWTVLLVTALSFALCTLAARESRACSYRAVRGQLVADRVPLHGPILLDVYCQKTDYCTLGSPTPVITRDGENVPGRLEILHAGDRALYLSFFPEAPLVDGARYDVALGTDGRHDYYNEFTVTADGNVSWQAPVLSALPWSLSDSRWPEGDAICCPARLSCFGTCFHEREIRSAALTPLFEDRDPRPSNTNVPAHVFQLRYRDGEIMRESGWLRPETRPSALFTQPAARYCATLQMRSLVDGVLVEQEVCRDADPAVPYGERSVPEWDKERFTFGDCREPPGADPACDPTKQRCAIPSERLLAAWCAAQRSECKPDSDARTADCRVVDAYCGASADADAAEGGAGQSSQPSAASCSAAAHAGRRDSSSLLLAMLAWLRLRSGRRRQSVRAPPPAACHPAPD